MSTFSVVIPVLNGSRHIADAINCVLGQTRSPDEIIVVDNMSTDDTAKIVKSFAVRDERIRLIQNPRIGVSSTRNLGIETATGRYVAFLDADDLWDDRKIETHFDHFRIHPNCVFSFTNSFEISVSEHLSRTESVLNSGYSFRSLLSNEFVVNGSASSAVISREILFEIGCFDESMDFGEDWDLWLRVGKFYQLCEIRETLVTIQKQSNSVQMQTYQNLKDFHRTFALLIQWSRYLEFFEGNVPKSTFFSTAGSDLISNWKNPCIRDGSWARQIFQLSSLELQQVLGFTNAKPQSLPTHILFQWFRERIFRSFLK